MKVTDLRDQISHYFNQVELRDLCFDLGIDHEALTAGPKGELVRELVTYCARRNRIGDLVERCRLLRPQGSWPDISEEALEEYLATAGEAGLKDGEPAGSGDRYQVNIGDVSDAQIAIGKDITQVRSESAGKLPDLLNELQAAIRAEATGDRREMALSMLQGLKEEVQVEEPDLKRLEKIRGFLIDLGGGIAATTRRLFTSQEMQSVLKIAAEVAVAATLRRLGGDT